MQFKTLASMLHEREVLNTRIRAMRVVEIRRRAVMLSKDSKTTSSDAYLIFTREVEQMNKMLLAVHYAKDEMDELLDLLEDTIENLGGTLLT